MRARKLRGEQRGIQTPNRKRALEDQAKLRWKKLKSRQKGQRVEVCRIIWGKTSTSSYLCEAIQLINIIVNYIMP